MSRWRIAWLIGLASAFLVLWFHASGPGLLNDSDTAVLLRTIHAKNAPFSWFWSDWPLYNHFYRPIPTLTFELDSRLYGAMPAGYGWTNALWAAGSVLALFWLLRELLDNPFPAAAGALLFALWQTSFLFQILSLVGYCAYAVLFIGIYRHRKRWRSYVPAVFTLFLLQQVLAPLEPLNSRMLGWLPGRTASTMTLFALVAMAAYCRYERLRPSDVQEEATSQDKPATKGSRLTKPSKIPRSTWIALSIVASVGAFACYEQAVMLPACLLGLCVYFRLTGRKVNWWLQGAFWMILIAYLSVRHQVIPPGKSSYQAQQLKTGIKGPINDLISFLYPPLGTIVPILNQRDEGIYVIFDASFQGMAWLWVVYLAGTYQLRRLWKLSLAGWLLPFLAFMPMAFVKMFEHYYYWPMALRTILVIATGTVAFKLALTAVSPPTLQAPQRLDPAPGSLPGR